MLYRITILLPDYTAIEHFDSTVWVFFFFFFFFFGGGGGGFSRNLRDLTVDGADDLTVMIERTRVRHSHYLKICTVSLETKKSFFFFKYPHMLHIRTQWHNIREESAREVTVYLSNSATLATEFKTIDVSARSILAVPVVEVIIQQDLFFSLPRRSSREYGQTCFLL